MNLRSIEKRIYNGKKLNASEEKHLLRKIDEYWDNHPDVSERFPRWRKYCAWVAGYQLYDYNKYTKKLIEVPLKRRRKIVFNRLRSFVRALLAKLAADTPNMSVVPKTDEDEDIEAARAGNSLVQSIQEKIGFVDTLNSLKLWLIVTNRAYLRVFWNEDDYGIVGYEPITTTDEDTGIETEGIDELKDDGDVGMEAVSPFHCRCDPLYWERDKWRWFLFGEEVDAQMVEEEYDIDKGTIEETSKTLDTAFDLEAFDDEALFTSSTGSREDITGRTVVFKEFWTPSIYVFAAGNKILDYDVNPYGEIPFFAVEDRLLPISNYEKGFQYNESLVKDAIGIQREYNRQISLMSTALDRASKLKILVPFGSLTSKKFFTNDYGVFMDYNSKLGAAPHQMKLDPLPSFVQTYKTELEREFETSFGVREASFGRLPERASHASGTLVNLLLEQDDVLLNPLLAAINGALSKAWGLALRMVKDNYTTQRLIRCVGEDGEYSVKKFKGADLRGNTDVKVVSKAGLPRSRALRVEYIMKLFELGLIQDPQDVLSMLEFGAADKVFKDSLLHKNRADRENQMIRDNPDMQAQHMQTWIYPTEDHFTHDKIHKRMRLGIEYEKLTDNQKNLLNTHLQMHQEAILALQQQQMEMQMMAEQKTMGQSEEPGGQSPQ